MKYAFQFKSTIKFLLNCFSNMKYSIISKNKKKQKEKKRKNTSASL